MMKYLKACGECGQSAGYHSIYRRLWEKATGTTFHAHGFKMSD